MSRLLMWVLAAVLLAAPAAGFAQVLDNAGFETGDFPQWVVVDSTPPSNVFPVVFDSTGIIDTYEAIYGPGYWDPPVSFLLQPYAGNYSCGWARQGAMPAGFPGEGWISYIEQDISVTPGVEVPIYIDCVTFMHHEADGGAGTDPWGVGIAWQVFKDGETTPSYEKTLWRKDVTEDVWELQSFTDSDLTEDPITRILSTTGQLTFRITARHKHTVDLDVTAVDDVSLSFDKPGLGDIHGTVTEAGGGPLEGALITAIPDVGVVEGHALSAADGGYQINSLEPGTYTVTCELEHYVSWQQTGVVVPPDGIVTVNIQLVPITLGTLKGYVTDELGNPLEGADVTITSNTYNPPPVYTDEFGYYEFVDIDSETYTVTAHYPGYEPGIQTGVVVAGPPVQVDFQLFPRVFTGLVNGGFELPVTDPYNDPVPGWTVYNAGWDGMTGYFTEVTDEQAYEGTQSMVNYFGHFESQGVSQPDGTFLLENVRTRPGQETQYTVTASKEGYLDASKSKFTVYPDTINDAGTFVLRIPGLSGTVIEYMTDTPIQGATITAVEDGGGDPVVATTNEDGLYRMDYLAPGTYTVTAEYGSFVTQIRVGVVVTDTANTTVNFEMDTAGIHGRCVKQVDGTPISGVTVTATSPTQNPPAAVTNSLGKYHIDAPPETYSVSTQKLGYKSQTVTGVVVLPDETTTQDFELVIGFGEPAPSGTPAPPNDGYGSISGYVEDMDGVPQGGATIVARGPDSWGASMGAYQEVYVTPGKTYKLTGYWMSEVLVPGGNNWATVALIDGPFDLENAEGPLAGQWQIAKHDTDGAPNAEPPQPPLGPTPFAWTWESFADAPFPQTAWFQGEVTATGEILTVVLRSGHLGPPESGARVYFDDVQLVEVEGGAPRQISQAANCWEGSPVDLSRPEDAKVVTGVFDYLQFGQALKAFYIEDDDRTAGIEVVIPIEDTLPAIGDRVSVSGVIGVRRTDPLNYYEPGERILIADPGSVVVRSSGNDLPEPVGVTNEAMTGAFKYLMPLPGVFGAPNQGLLVTVWGTVVGEPFYGPYGALDYIIDDGSGIGVLVNTNQWFQDPMLIPPAGTYVAVTGCSGVESYNYQPMKTIRPRPELIYSDIRIVSP